MLKIDFFVSRVFLYFSIWMFNLLVSRVISLYQFPFCLSVESFFGSILSVLLSRVFFLYLYQFAFQQSPFIHFIQIFNLLASKVPFLVLKFSLLVSSPFILFYLDIKFARQWSCFIKLPVIFNNLTVSRVLFLFSSILFNYLARQQSPFILLLYYLDI